MRTFLIYIISILFSVELALAQQNDIVYKIDSLKEVLVTTPKPHVKVEDNGGFSFNVKELLENTIVDNALDLLQEIPIVSRDGNVFSIPGLGEVKLTINGRTRTMSQEQVYEILAMTDPSRIKKIEVFFKSPASSGIKGSSINLDIDNGRSDELKLSGSLKTVMYQAKKFYPLGYVYGTIESKKWSLDMTYSLGQSKRVRETDNKITNHLKSSDHDLVLFDKSANDNFAHRLTTTFTYDLNNGGHIIVGNYYRNDDNKTNKSFNGTDNGSFYAEGKAPIISKKNDNSSYLEYVKGSLNIGINATLFDNTSTQNNDTKLANGRSSYIDTETSQRIHKYHAYFDNSKKLKYGTFGYGLRYYYIDVSTKQEITRNSGDREFASNVDSKYKEHELQGYVEWTQKIGDKIVLNADIWLEYQKAFQKSNNEKNELWNKVNALPDINVNYNIDKNHVLQFAFSSNNLYPSFSQSTPRSYYSSYYFQTSGNPNLIIGKKQSFNINYILYRNVIFGAFANICQDQINQYLRTSEKSLHGTYSYENFNHVNNYGVSASATQKWNEYFNQKLSLEIGMNDVYVDKENLYLKKNQNYFSGNISNNLILDKKKNLLFNFTALYKTKNISSIYLAKDRFDARVSLSYKLPKKGWNFILQGQNIFNTANTKTKSLLENQTVYTELNNDSQCVVFTARYNWNGYKDKKEKDIDKSRMGL